MDENKVKLTFGLTIKQIRISRSLSQEQLAEITGLHRTYISEVERGDRNLSLINIIKLCNALQIKPSQFFKSFEEGL